MVRLALAALRAAGKGSCIGPRIASTELPLAHQFANRPDHQVFLSTALVLLGLAAHGQPQLGAFSGTARLTVFAHSHAGIAFHAGLPGRERHPIPRISPTLLPAAVASGTRCLVGTATPRVQRRFGPGGDAFGAGVMS